MSETEIKAVIFKNKSGIKYMLLWSPKEELWTILMSCNNNKNTVCIASFGIQSDAIAFCEMIEKSL